MLVSAFAAACQDGPTASGGVRGIDGGVADCVDRDGDGYGQNCLLGADCDDDDAAVTYECRGCVRPERGCPCDEGQPPEPCFDHSQRAADGTLICHEGTRYCRDGVYSACEGIQSYVAPESPESTSAVNDGVTPENCDGCRFSCFLVEDPLTDIDGSVTLGDGGVVSLPPGDGGASGMGTGDGGTVVISGGPPAGCTFGAPPDSDCDGIPDTLDEFPSTPPIAGNDNQAIFFQLGPGDVGVAQLRLSYRVRNADVYFLLDMSTTMSGERDNLISGLTSGNFYSAISGAPADCPDLDNDGLPDNDLKNFGIVGAIRCLIGGAWLGTGYFRDVPYGPSGHDDEHLYRHLVDMTPDVERVRAALRSMRTNANRDFPEAGTLALWSLATGRGQWFGVNRPAVADRLNGGMISPPVGCPAGTRGFPCFRDGPVPIVVLFTDDEFANGPGSAPTRNSFTVAGDQNSESFARFTPVTAETFSSATSMGDLVGNHFTLIGDTTNMRSDIPLSVMGCGTDASAPDVVYLFRQQATGQRSFRFDVIDAEDDNTPATDFNMAMALFGGIPGAIEPPIDLADATQYNIVDGPDFKYLTYVGTTDGAASQRGFLGGISGCGADGATNQMIFTFNPSVDANVILDAASSGFDAVLSLHEGGPSDLPPNPAPTAITNSNDDFASAAPIAVQDRYRSYVGNSGLNPSMIDADYGFAVVGCGANPATKDSVFTFTLSEPRRVLLDTEGSSIGTVMSLHDGPPPDIQVTTDITGNDLLPGYSIGNVRGANIELRSGNLGTQSLSANYTGLGCGSDDTTPDGTFSFNVDQSTDVRIAVGGLSGFDPVVALFAGLPGDVTTVDGSANTNNDVASALDLGDVLALEELQVQGGDTAAGSLTEVYSAVEVGCATNTSAADAVYSFTVGADTTVRARVSAATWDASLAIFAGADPQIQATNRLACDITESGVDLDVYAGTTYYLVVKGQAVPPAGEGAYTLDLRALFESRSELDNGAGGNETGELAFDLPDVYRSKVLVEPASTAGMSADYAADCGTDDGAPDAVYRLSASLPTRVDIAVTPDPLGPWTPAVSLYDGLPPQLVPVIAASGNEDSATAQPVVIAGAGQRVTGNTSGMLHDVDASLLGCGADPAAPDAAFSFSVSEPTEVSVTVPSAGFGTVLGLFAGDVAAAPTSAVLENDTVAEADATPSPTPDVTGNWLRYSADMANLTLSSQTPRSETATNANATAASAFALGDIYGQLVTVGGGDTTSLTGDYLGSLVQCGAADDGPDAVYSFTSSADTSVRVRLSPEAGYDATIALFDGGTTPLLPRLASDTPVVTTLGDTNNSFSMPEAVTIGAEQTYVGDTANLLGDNLEATLYDEAGGATCGAGLTSRDAIFNFSLAAPTYVGIDSAGSSIATTVALYDANALPLPESAQSMQNDTRAAAAGNPVGAVDGRWPVFNGNLGALTNSATTPRSVAAGNTNDTGATAQSLGDVSGSAITVTGASTTGLGSDYVLSCGANWTAPDAVYSFTASASTSVRISASAGYTPVLALYDGPPPTGYPYTPSNFDPNDTAINWATAPNLTFDSSCTGTPTFDSTAGTFSNWCGNATPQVLIRTQSNGSEVAILVVGSINIHSGRTLRLTGGRAVILAVWGDAIIDGAIDASSTSSLVGAGANWNCGGAAGSDGSGSSSGGGGGGGGGGFGTAGGRGGEGDGNNYGPGGSTRGTASLVPLTAGCPGGRGGGCSANGADGGGAFQISARGQVTLGGALRADGESGQSGCGSEGGGTGGGSGGGILVEGANIAGSGILQANGGNGGRGSNGGSGGSGSTSASSAGSQGQDEGANGGGGGGGGYGRVLQSSAGAGGGASQLACGALQIEVPVTAGNTYYLVVKGNGAADAGAYGLSLQAAGNDILGCPDDVYAADAFFEFSLASAAEVRLDTGASNLDTVLALYNDDGTLRACDDDSAGAGDSRITQALPAGTYYAVVKPKSGTPGNLDYRLSIRDNDGVGSLVCADGAATSGVNMMQMLPAGDYYVALSSQAADGSYRLRFQDLDAGYATWLACDTATDTLTYDVVAGNTYYVIVKGDAAGEVGTYSLEVQSSGAVEDLGCGADPASADAFYRFTLSEETRVRIDTEGSALDTVIGLFPAGTAVFDTTAYAIDAQGAVVGCDNDGGSSAGASAIEADLVPGSYYVVVKSDDAVWGGGDLPFNLSIRDEGALGALACAAPGGSIVQTVEPGDYTVILSSDSATGGSYTVQLANQDVASGQTGTSVACDVGGQLSADLALGQDYYLVVKGDLAGDEGAYDVVVQDALSVSGTTGSAPIACTDQSAPLEASLPPGNYFLIVKGIGGTAGDYALTLQDVIAQSDNNRLACDDDSGPADTSVIEADLAAGTYWVVVKGDGPADVGSYQLNVRDLDAVDDHRLACAGVAEGSRIETSLTAGQDYTLVLKGNDGGQGAYDVKLYDPENLTGAASGRLACTNNNTALQATLDPGNYYLALKGQRTADRGIYQLHARHTAPTTGVDRTYTPPTWAETRDALQDNGVIVLPVMSGTPGSSLSQARAIASATGAETASGTPIVQQISPSGNGLGSELVQAINDLAANLTLNVAVRPVYEPDAGASAFNISVTALAASSGCDATPTGSMQTNCRPGAVPQFDVSIENPAASPVPNNPDDPFGGYHFRLELVGTNQSTSNQYILDTVPVYIVPDLTMGPPAPGSVQPSGSFTRDLIAIGCTYYQAEGEAPATDSCSDGIDNDGDGLIDRGIDSDGDGSFETPPDPDCAPGTCTDMFDNDGDSAPDLEDPDCATNQQPDWFNLYYNASIPPGARLTFEACTASTEPELDGCTFGAIATVTSNGATCSAPGDCLAMTVDGMTRDGYCGVDGMCQFLDPITSRPACTSDANCENGTYLGMEIRSTCDTSTNECVYTTPPADIGAGLPEGNNLQPYLRTRITLEADATATAGPSLYDYWVTYNCTNAQ